MSLIVFVISLTFFPIFSAIAEPAARRETIAWIRAEFEHNMNVQDIGIIKGRLSSIRRDLKEILPSLGSSTGKQ